jgi:glycosyltransferase involved in cell wall biosynthesis
LALSITNKWSHINTVVSSDMAVSIIEKHITNVKPIIIRNGINLKDYINQNVELRRECRQELEISETDIIITALGQLRKAKGYFDLLNAITILKNKYSNIHYLIIGGGELYSKIQNKIKEYHLNKDFNLLGQKNNPEFYLNASDIYVLPSLWEGFPNALLEAMACGLPSVATKVSGVTEIIQNGQNGFLAEPNNSIDLANKLEKLILMTKKERTRIGLVARQTVEKYYSVEKMVSEYEKLYD